MAFIFLTKISLLMQYITEILIEKPIQDVILKMDTTANLKHWQEGFVSAEQISGTPREFGAKLKLKYDFGNRRMEVIETITKQNFPSQFDATYTTNGIRNIQQNHFESTKKGYTKWICKNIYEPTSFKMNAMLLLMPRTFKKQTKRYMKNFKNFVEHETSVANA